MDKAKEKAPDLEALHERVEELKARKDELRQEPWPLDLYGPGGTWRGEDSDSYPRLSPREWRQLKLREPELRRARETVSYEVEEAEEALREARATDQEQRQAAAREQLKPIIKDLDRLASELEPLVETGVVLAIEAGDAGALAPFALLVEGPDALIHAWRKAYMAADL